MRYLRYLLTSAALFAACTAHAADMSLTADIKQTYRSFPAGPIHAFIAVVINEWAGKRGITTEEVWFVSPAEFNSSMCYPMSKEEGPSEQPTHSLFDGRKIVWPKE